MQYLSVDGEPPSKARARVTKSGRVYSGSKQVAAEMALKWELKQAFRKPRDGNIALACIFYRSSFQRIDADNMLKHVCDSANGIIWHDDVQVTAILGIVEYDPDNPRTIIIVGEHESTMVRSQATKKCEHCSETFNVGQVSNRKFCSRTCSSRHHHYPRNSVCAYCEKIFLRVEGGQRHCSEACKEVAVQGRKRQTKPLCCDCGVTLSKLGYLRCRACWRKSIKTLETK